MNFTLKKADTEAEKQQAYEVRYQCLTLETGDELYANHEVKTFVETKKELLEKAQAGDEGAMEELKNLRQQRMENREERKTEAKALMDEKKEVRDEVRQEVKEVRKEMRSSTN